MSKKEKEGHKDGKEITRSVLGMNTDAPFTELILNTCSMFTNLTRMAQSGFSYVLQLVRRKYRNKIPIIATVFSEY
jgi:hypothetical protein